MVVEAIENLGIVATGTAAFGLVARYGIQRFSGVVEQGIERSAEAVEHGIERFFEKEIARHQAELEAHRAVSSGLHEARASIIVELYQRFVRFERDISALTAGRSSEIATDELLQAATESGNEFATYYTEHKIYFPAETCDTVESAQDAMNEVLDDFRVGPSAGGRPEQRAADESRLADRRTVTGEEVPELACELETHLRELLGIDLDGARLEDVES